MEEDLGPFCSCVNLKRKDEESLKIWRVYSQVYLVSP